MFLNPVSTQRTLAKEIAQRCRLNTTLKAAIGAAARN
jgi:hypothetical protein